jgi:predicted permease
MTLWSRFRSWLLAILRRTRMESDMDAELRFHIEAFAEDLVRSGVPREEALRRARIEFGGIERAKEECRDARRVNFVENLLQDLRFGLRMLRKSPGFTFIAVLTLALGIGANAAIFSAVNTVLLRPLPYKDADRLVTVWSQNRARGFDTDQVSPLDFADWRSQNHVFEGMAASTDVTYTLTGAGEPTLIIAYSFSPDYFHVLGVSPLFGRTFLPEEEEPGKNHVAVLSYSFWQRHFGGNRDLVGKSILLDGAPYAVVGVMPAGFQYPPFTELWTPFTVNPEAAQDRAYRYLRVMARLKPGVTIRQAQTEMNTIAARLALEYPKTNKDESETNLISLREMISGDIRPALLVLLCAVGFVLLIACANVANLLLARAAGRQKEVAVRSALGASRWRLVRQFLTESMLLGLAGGALGLLLASWCARALVRMFPPTIFNISIPHLEKIPMDGWVMGFAVAASLLTSVLFGLVPALHATVNTENSLKESGRGLAGSTKGKRFRSALVVAELALSLILLTAAGLTLRSFVHLLGSDLGFNPDDVLTVRVLLPGYKYKTAVERIAFSEQALAQIRSLPGVKAAGTVTFLPLSGWWGVRGVSVEGQSALENQKPIAPSSSVTPDYFRAMGIPLVKGRFFEDHDDQGAPPVAIISKSLAQRLMPNSDPLGKRLEVDGVKGAVAVVGVVSDVSQLGTTSPTTAGIYLPFSQAPAPIICFAIRTVEDPLSVVKAAQNAIWAVDKDQAVGYVMSMNQLTSDSLAPQRILMIVLGVFGGLALLMAVIGTYGVIASSAAQRTHEIGVRMALGARPDDVLRLVVGQGLGMVLLGVVIGLAGTFGLMRFVSSLLYGVRPTDQVTLVVAAVVLAGAALLASYIPARRASRVDPMVALRYE